MTPTNPVVSAMPAVRRHDRHHPLRVVAALLLAITAWAALPAGVAQAHTQYTYDNCTASGHNIGTRNTWGHLYQNAAGDWAVSLPQLWVNRSTSGPVYYAWQVYNADGSMQGSGSGYDSDGSWAGNVSDAYAIGQYNVLVAVQTAVWGSGPYCYHYHYNPPLHF